MTLLRSLSKIIWGLIFVAAGVLFGLNAVGLTDVEVFFDGWWTLFIIVPCFVGLFTERKKMGNIIGLLIGIALLLWRRGILRVGLLWKLIFPAAVVLIGLSMIFGGIGISKRRVEVKVGKADPVSGFAVFSGKTMRFDGEVFHGAEINAIFGGVKCDLTKAIFEGDAVINASAIFGGVDIIVPAGVNVKVNSNSLFGGVNDKNHVNIDGNPYTVYINANSVFGGIDIK